MDIGIQNLFVLFFILYGERCIWVTSQVINHEQPPVNVHVPEVNTPLEPHVTEANLKPSVHSNDKRPLVNQPQDVHIPNQFNPPQQQAASGFGNPNANSAQQPGQPSGFQNQPPNNQGVNQNSDLKVNSADPAHFGNPSQAFNNQPPSHPSNTRQENFANQDASIVNQNVLSPGAPQHGNIQGNIQGNTNQQQAAQLPPAPQPNIPPQTHMPQQPPNVQNMPRSGHVPVPPQVPPHVVGNPGVQMQQVFHQPVPSMHPPHAAGVVFSEEQMAAMRQHPESHLPNQFQGAPPVERVPDVYNQARHHHPLDTEHDESDQFSSWSHRPYEANPPDEFVSIMVVVPPGTKNCYFYTPIIDFIVYYQVVRGGAMDVGVQIIDPDGRVVVKQRPMEDGKFPISVPSHFRMRSYAVCLDNRKASFDEKHTSMMIDIDVNWDNPSKPERDAIEFLRRRSVKDTNVPAMNREYADGWKAIDDRVEGLYGRLHRIKLLQQRSNNFASADKALMESNLQRVFQGSALQMLLMLGVAAFQVVLIRALFDPDSRFYRLWFGKRSIAGTRC